MHETIFPFQVDNPDVQEVISRSLAIGELEVATDATPNLETRKEIETVRTIIATIIHDEQLLKKCIQPNDIFTLRREVIPDIICEAAKKAGINLTDLEILDVASSFDGWYLTIGLYLKNSFGKESVYEALCEYSKRYFEHKYLIELVKKAKQLIQLFLPSIYIDLPYKVSFLNLYDQNATYRTDEAGKSVITYENKDDVSQHREYDSLTTLGVFENSLTEKPTHEFKRGIHDLIIVIHEYAHGIYRSLVTDRGDKKYKEKSTKKIEYYHSLDAALNEGFAILIETIIINRLISNPQTLDLTPTDIEDLRTFKSQRFLSLIKKQKTQDELAKRQDDDDKNPEKTHKYNPDLIIKSTAYSQGFIRLISKLYRLGGIEQVISLLKSIDPHKTKAIKRNSQLYREIIIYGNSPQTVLQILKEKCSF